MKSERQRVYEAMDKANGIKPKKQLPTVAALKKKAWKLCSEYVRRVDADSYGFVTCYTCPNRKHWKDMQAGHLVSGRGHKILFDIRGIKPQCYSCNCLNYGRSVAFLIHMEAELGAEKTKQIRDELHEIAKMPHKFTHEEMFKQIEWFAQAIETLKQKVGQ